MSTEIVMEKKKMKITQEYSMRHNTNISRRNLSLIMIEIFVGSSTFLDICIVILYSYNSRFRCTRYFTIKRKFSYIGKMKTVKIATYLFDKHNEHTIQYVTR